MRVAVFLRILSIAFLCSACTQASGVVVANTSSPVLSDKPTETPLPTETSLPTASPNRAVAQATATPAPTEGNRYASTSTADETVALNAELLELGKDVFRRQSCGVCHTLAAVGSQGTFGPPHDNLAERAAERIYEERYKGGATTPAEYIRESIVDPQAFMVEGYQITRFPMPIFTNLSAREVDALVYLLMQPSTAPVP